MDVLFAGQQSGLTGSAFDGDLRTLLQKVGFQFLLCFEVLVAATAGWTVEIESLACLAVCFALSM